MAGFLLLFFELFVIIYREANKKRMDETETQAIKKCQSGDREEFGQLYDRYIKKIYDFVYYKTQHKETAEDLVSQIFTKALSKIGSFNTNKGTFQAWLYQIARNTVIDHYRTRKKDRNIEDIFDLASEIDIERDTEVKIKLAEVEEYLRDLKPEQRDIILMRVWQGMSYRDISVIMGKSEASCKMMYSRGINKLRNEIPLVLLIYFVTYL
jgi:RNA polymerase sigma-70 factor (ECF subfamily)